MHNACMASCAFVLVLIFSAPIYFNFYSVPGRRPSRGTIGTDATRTTGSGNNSSTEEEAARHAALVISAANSQSATGTGVTGTGAQQLEESVDERQTRERLHTGNSEEVGSEVSIACLV